jgi:hypothetical protein
VRRWKDLASPRLCSKIKSVRISKVAIEAEEKRFSVQESLKYFSAPTPKLRSTMRRPELGAGRLSVPLKSLIDLLPISKFYNHFLKVKIKYNLEGVFYTTIP